MWEIRLRQFLLMIIAVITFIVLCKATAFYLVIPALACFLYGLIEPYWIENKATVFAHKKVPETFENFKIVFISDIHHGISYSKRRIKALVKRINMHEPDLVLLGGDYVDQKKYVHSLFEELKELRAKYGVYGVLGNHDHWTGVDAVTEAMENAGIKCLDNKAIWVNKGMDRIRIGGVGDLWNDKQDLSPTIEGVNEEFTILLSHNPDYAEVFQTNKICLMLCGHTHGGQGTVFGLWAPFIPSKYGQKYRTGIVQLPHTTVLVSNGIGTAGRFLPIRFFARPQINIIYLRKRTGDL